MSASVPNNLSEITVKMFVWDSVNTPQTSHGQVGSALMGIKLWSSVPGCQILVYFHDAVLVTQIEIDL